MTCRAMFSSVITLSAIPKLSRAKSKIRVEYAKSAKSELFTRKRNPQKYTSPQATERCSNSAPKIA